MKRLTTHSEADAIEDFLAGKLAQLSPALQRKLKRMETAADLVRKYGSRTKAVAMLRRLAEYTEMGAASQATAYRDVDDAITVLGTAPRESRDFYVDRLLEMSFSSHAKATEAQDWRAVAAIEKNIAGIIKDFMGDKEAVDWSKLQPPRILVGFMPELLNVPMPENLEEQVAQLLKKKRGKHLTIEDAEDAQIITE